jgi:hypothetical protein
MRAKSVVSLLLLFCLVFTAAAYAAGLTDPENYEITVGEKTYIISVDSIGSDENGNTTVTLAGFDPTILSFGILMKISCNGEQFACNGTTIYNPSGCMMTYCFDTTLQPQSILLYNDFVPNLVEFKLLGGGATDDDAAPENMDTESSDGEALEPVSSDSIRAYDGGMELTHAEAALHNLPITIWGFKGDVLTDGPYLDWRIYTEDGSFTGLNIYVVNNGSSSSVQDFYNNELAGWEKGVDVSGDGYNGFSWTRGNQAFAAVIIEESPFLSSAGTNLSMLFTYLLNQ